MNLDNIDYVDGRLMLEVERAGRRQQIPLLSEVQRALEAYLDVKDERAEGDERGYALFTDRSGETSLDESVDGVCQKKSGGQQN